MITKEKVLEAQNEWGNGVVKIGSLKADRSECESFTSDFLDQLYSFQTGPVLFKPTKCAIEQFRPQKQKPYLISSPVMIALVKRIMVLLLTLGQKLDLKTQT